MWWCVRALQRSKSDACDEQIQDEVQRQVKKCVCPKQYHMHKITDGQYRVRPPHYFLALSSVLTALTTAAVTTVSSVIFIFFIVIALHRCDDINWIGSKSVLHDAVQCRRPHSLRKH